MPPKSTGRGATRGRGSRGRGGATSARAAAGSSAGAEPERQAESSNAVDDTESEPAKVEDPDASATVESQPGSGTGASPGSARAPAQRLESLQSTLPAIRRSGSNKVKKPAPIKPTFTGRRSKLERDALQKQVMERDQERERERLADERSKGHFAPNRNNRAQNTARGGFTGAVSGPFSAGSVAKDKRRDTGRITTVGSRSMRIKREDHDDEGGYSTSSGPAKQGDGGYASSDADDISGVPRKDIDTIEISSDENDAAPTRGRIPSMLPPVRVGRREHVDRVIGINTDASSETAARLLQQADAAGTEIKAEWDDIELPKGKGKGKAKDVEITGVREPYKGMWQEIDEPQHNIKSEPMSDDEDEDMPDAEPIRRAETNSDTEEKKRKIRARSALEPALQTEEDRAEHSRLLAHRTAVRVELGPEEEMVEVRDASSYLFQFPPSMPNVRLQDADIKAEAKPAPPATNATRGKITGEKRKEKKQTGLQLAPGRVGTISVRKSGRATLYWGEASYDVIPGQPATFLQEAALLETDPPQTSTSAGARGNTYALGPIKGKFVVKPRWDKMI